MQVSCSFYSNVFCHISSPAYSLFVYVIVSSSVLFLVTHFLSPTYKPGTQSGVLDLTSHHLSPKASIAIAEALRPDSSFITAIFGDCMLGDEGCCVIMEALKSNRTVTTLDLRYVNASFSFSFMLLLYESMSVDSSFIHYLYAFRGNNIRSDGATALAALLRKNVTIAKYYSPLSPVLIVLSNAYPGCL